MTTPNERTTGFFNQQLETASIDERNRYLVDELKKIAMHAYANAPAIKRKFDQSQIKPEDIKSLSDLEYLPITHKSELASLQQQDPPFGGFLGVPVHTLKRIYMSPGPIYEPEDSHINDRWAQAFFAAGFRKGDIGQVTFSYHMVPAAFWFEEALFQLGCAATPGGVGNTEMQLRMIKDLGVTGFIGTPSFLYAVAKKAREFKIDPLNDLNLDVAFVAGEKLSDSLRNELEQIFSMLVRQGYGTADVGCLGYECFFKCGMHYPYNVIVEIVDPQTGKQLGPGQTGEIVATVFDKAYPMIRFGTGDLSYYLEEPCQCGRTTFRLARIIGRVDEVTKVKGMFIHPANAQELAAKFNQIDRFQVIVTRSGHEDKMTFHIELKNGVIADEALASQIEEAIPQVMRVRGQVKFIEPGTLKEGIKIIDDQRNWDE